jgi:hypothetical protein
MKWTRPCADRRHRARQSRSSTSLWRCGTRGRPCQTLREFRVLVDTSRINLVLGKVFYCCKVGVLELCALQVGVLDGNPRQC